MYDIVVAVIFVHPETNRIVRAKKSKNIAKRNTYNQQLYPMFKHNKIKTKVLKKEKRNRQSKQKIGKMKKIHTDKKDEPRKRTREQNRNDVHILLNCWYLRTYTNRYMWAQTHTYLVPCVWVAIRIRNITLRLQFSTELDSSSVCYTHFLISNAWLYVRFVRLC